MATSWIRHRAGSSLPYVAEHCPQAGFPGPSRTSSGSPTTEDSRTLARVLHCHYSNHPQRHLSDACIDLEGFPFGKSAPIDKARAASQVTPLATGKPACLSCQRFAACFVMDAQGTTRETRRRKSGTLYSNNSGQIRLEHGQAHCHCWRGRLWAGDF